MLEFGEHLFNWIEIGAVRRQKQQPSADRFDCGANCLALMAGEIIHDDKISWPKCWQQKLFDVALEACPVYGAVKNTRRCDTVTAKSGKEGHRLPVAMRHKSLQAAAFLTPAAQRGHIGLSPCFVNKDETRGINAVLVFLPPISAACNIRPKLFSSKNCFF